MTAKELISQSILPVQTSDLGIQVLDMMQANHVSHLPIVNHEQLLGVISEDDILIHNTEDPIGTYRLSYLRPFCLDNDHIFEVMARLGKLELTVIPVIDAEEKYLGVITVEDLMKYLAVHFSFTEPGGIVVIETSRENFSLSEIARIAESEEVTILSSFVNSVPDSFRLFITLKLNKQNIQAFKASLHRFGYDVYASFSEAEYSDDLKERYDSLMAYLNV
ncbi:MAG: CBS domain-containing protein [Saprospiraceae bacterium]|nr:MAG: hypothetical protein UZ09_BCD002000908 [Bacteroidetes bacterium OLB9]MCO6463071.1 CBS domain-containing protein [Saprospiraceae bacterium]MCZ2339424.1 CBS domain-containing protein [Chitinophagales bacterium]